MRRVRQGVFWVGVGLCLLMAGLYWLLIADTAQATPPLQDGDEPPNLGAEYVGTVFCRMCHTQEEAWHASGHAQIVRPPSAETILGDLSDTAAVTITWPDGSERPITADDITYVLGGRYIQQYVSVIEQEDGTANYYVLPVTWNIPQSEDQVGVWTPYHLEDWQEPARDWRAACAGCHTTGLDRATAAEATAFAFVRRVGKWRSRTERGLRIVSWAGRQSPGGRGHDCKIAGRADLRAVSRAGARSERRPRLTRSVISQGWRWMKMCLS